VCQNKAQKNSQKRRLITAERISDMSNPRNGTPEQDKYKGMRRMVFFIMILVPLLPFIPVLVIGYYYFTGSLQTNTLATVNRIVEDHRQMIETFLRERRANLEFVVNSYSYEDLAEPEKFYHVFTQLQQVLLILFNNAIDAIT